MLNLPCTRCGGDRLLISPTNFAFGNSTKNPMLFSLATVYYNRIEADVFTMIYDYDEFHDVRDTTLPSVYDD